MELTLSRTIANVVIYSSDIIVSAIIGSLLSIQFFCRQSDCRCRHTSSFASQSVDCLLFRSNVCLSMVVVSSATLAPDGLCLLRAGLSKRVFVPRDRTKLRKPNYKFTFHPQLS